MKFIFSALSALVLTFTASTAFGACSDPEGPNVNWYACDQKGEWLTNSPLRNASLRRVYLSGADLKYADLTFATWIDHRVCLEPSYGKCK